MCGIGAGGDNYWANSANWGGAAPLPHQWLRFGTLAPGGHTDNSNNIASNPLFYGIFFDSLAPSYDLQGNAIQLSGEVSNQSGNDQEISLDLQLVPGNGVFDTGTFDARSNGITVAGSISGPGMTLVKTGGGALILCGTNSYDGGTDVEAGTLIVESSTALLNGSSLSVGPGVTHLFGASLQAAPVASDVQAVPEPGTLVLLGVAGIVVAAAAWRRRRRG